MFTLIAEVQPRADQLDAYLGNATLLRPQLERVDGFIGNVRYRSLTRDGWILSLSDWRDEKALVRWRTAMHHHEVQGRGRREILQDYHLRVGQITTDTQVPAGYVLEEQRLDETDVGEGTTIVLISDKRPAEWGRTSNPPDCAEFLGLDPYAAEMVSWDVFDALLEPGDLILMLVFRDRAAADHFCETVLLKETARLRQVRVIRDYGMIDRREATQYYPEQRRQEQVRVRGSAR
jgi:heme-degrading monooxygenase HmoA